MRPPHPFLTPTPLTLTYADDGNKLFTDYAVRCQGLVELGTLARQADTLFAERYFHATDPTAGSAGALELGGENEKRRKPAGVVNLRAMTAMYTGCTLEKGAVRVSNWEARPLDEVQLECECLSFTFCFGI